MRICLSLLLSMAMPLWPQVVSPIQSGRETTGDNEMATPPPVNSNPSPTAVGAEMRSNYLRGGLTFNTSYVDDMDAGGAKPQSELIYSVLPTISADQTTPRRHLAFSYRPGFTFYEPTSALNEVDQNAIVEFKYRLTPHGTLNLNDTLQKNSTTFGLSDSAASGAVSGALPPAATGVVAPFSERLTNNAAGQFSLQVGPTAMIGAGGSWMKLHYPSAAETPGLYDSEERGGSGFYNRRISLRQYVGVNYEYSSVRAFAQNGQSLTEVHNLYAFYTLYPTRDFSISISGGPQHYSTVQTPFPKSGAWGPVVMADLRRQGLHTNFGANYSRQVTGGGGFLGAFTVTTANSSLQWQIARTWTVRAGENYSANKTVSSYQAATASNGHSISGSAMVGHSLGNQLSIEFEYDRVHQSYGGIASLADNPNSNRELISLAWQFTRPLGR